MDKQIIDRVNVKECKYYCNGKCERYEEFVEADYANYSVKCICEKENDLGTYDICDYQQLQRKEQECEELKKVNNTLTATRDKLLSDLWIAEENLKDYIEHYNRQCEQLDQLKQILAEIKESVYLLNDRTMVRKDICDRLDIILQKISEVEE